MSLSPSEDHPCSDLCRPPDGLVHPLRHCPPLRITPVPTTNSFVPALGGLSVIVPL